MRNYPDYNPDHHVFISLTRGCFALIDRDDLQLVGDTNWFVDEFGYARHACMVDGSRKTALMHRVVIGAEKGVQVDHINHSKLDNRRTNLRLATRQLQQLNKRLSTANTSGFRGVSWVSSYNKWRARIKYNGVTKSLGRFASAQEAADAYDHHAKQIFGADAWLNSHQGSIAPI